MNESNQYTDKRLICLRDKFKQLEKEEIEFSASHGISQVQSGKASSRSLVYRKAAILTQREINDFPKITNNARNDHEINENARFLIWHEDWKNIFSNEIQAREMFRTAQPGIL